jgi:hypothetical protein
MIRQENRLRGSLDNSGSVTASLLAALALCQHAPDTSIAFAFTDEEEGNPELNASFGRGARRLLRKLDSPKLCVSIDGHDLNEWCKIGAGATFAEKASRSRGAIVAPHLYATLKPLSAEMIAHGIQIQENLGTVSRSDDVAMIDACPNVLLLGYPLQNAHFNRGAPTAALSDIVNLSRVIFWTAMALTQFERE